MQRPGAWRKGNTRTAGNDGSKVSTNGWPRPWRDRFLLVQGRRFQGTSHPHRTMPTMLIPPSASTSITSRSPLNLASLQEPKLRDVYNARRSRSCSRLPDTPHRASKPDGDDTLWRNHPKIFDRIRTDLLKFSNARVKKFSREPPGKRVDLSNGRQPKAVEFTQPSLTGCSLTSFLSATDGLFKHAFAHVDDTKLRFVHLIDNPHWISPDERQQLFRKGFSLEQLAQIANRVFATHLPTWEATPIHATELSLSQLRDMLANAHSDQRFIFNYSGAALYHLSGNLGHFVHADAFKQHAGEFLVHIVESASYRYPADPWIPLGDVHDAMSRPTAHGEARGLIVLQRRVSEPLKAHAR